MRPISPTQRCVSGNVYKQTSPEITCTRRTIMGFLHETSLIWVISLGVKLWLVYFRSLHICKNYHINAKYMINSNIIRPRPRRSLTIYNFLRPKLMLLNMGISRQCNYIITHEEGLKLKHVNLIYIQHK